MSDEIEHGRQDRRSLAMAAGAFVWVFACGVVWIASGTAHQPGGLLPSVLIGFLAALPAFLFTLWLFFSGARRMLRGQPTSFGVMFFSAGTIGGALLMDLMLWSAALDRLYPTYFAHGRRLHHEGNLLAPKAVPGFGWADTGEPSFAKRDIPNDLRAGLAAQWRENASKEHASIAAFAQLTLDLMSVGAPARLIHSAQRASLDEVRHAEMAYGVAREIDGQDIGPAPFPEAHTRRELSAIRQVALAQIAVDALADGALNEGMAARLLGRLAKCGGSPELRRILSATAVDEARHARDSWDVIEWCLSEGGALVHRALSRAAETMPLALGSPLPDGARGGEWREWGIQGVDLEETEYASVRRMAQRRLTALLGHGECPMS